MIESMYPYIYEHISKDVRVNINYFRSYNRLIIVITIWFSENQTLLGWQDVGVRHGNITIHK